MPAGPPRPPPPASAWRGNQLGAERPHRCGGRRLCRGRRRRGSGREARAISTGRRRPARRRLGRRARGRSHSDSRGRRRPAAAGSAAISRPCRRGRGSGGRRPAHPRFAKRGSRRAHLRATRWAPRPPSAARPPRRGGFAVPERAAGRLAQVDDDARAGGVAARAGPKPRRTDPDRGCRRRPRRRTRRRAPARAPRAPSAPSGPATAPRALKAHDTLSSRSWLTRLSATPRSRNS